MRARLIKFSHETFSSLKVRNFRFYFAGQTLTISGFYMQSIALAWLVLQITNSGTALGFVLALQYVPVLLLGPWGGEIADRFPKKRLLILTQSTMGIVSILLAALALGGFDKLWLIYVLSFALGFSSLIEHPSRHTMIAEIVEKDELKNAVTLNIVMLNLTRILGPALAGIIIALKGLSLCFLFSGIFYTIGIVLTIFIRLKLSAKNQPLQKTGERILEGLRYTVSKPTLLAPLIMMAIIGTFTYEYPVSLALLAKNTFMGSAESYAALTTALGIGALVGGIATAGRKKANPSSLLIASLSFGISITIAAFMPNLYTTLFVLIIAGAFSTVFSSLVLTILQLDSVPELRGRVMAFFTMSYLGSTAIGAPIIGWIGEHASARWSLATGGLAAIVAASLGIIIMNYQKGPLVINETVTTDMETFLGEDEKLV
jgi:MFS family permease